MRISAVYYLSGNGLKLRQLIKTKGINKHKALIISTKIINQNQGNKLYRKVETRIIIERIHFIKLELSERGCKRDSSN